jgi:N-acetylmuramoyl-L-alanine amidase
MRAIRFIVVHTAAAYDAKRHRVVHQTYETVRRYHMMPPARYDAGGKLLLGTGGRGFKDIGYHRYVEGDGKIRLGRLDGVRGAHVEGFNDETLGICCSGHGDFEPFNAAQLASLVTQCVTWCHLYDLTAERVIGHNEAPRYGSPPVAKSCPGKIIDMDMIRARVRAGLAGTSSNDAPPSTQRDGSPPKAGA